MNILKDFWSEQIQNWPLAKENYALLEKVNTRKISFNNYDVFLQHNPNRIHSTVAKTDPVSIQNRECFLCSKNLPKEQNHVKFDDIFSILINPFPVFPQHYTITHAKHIPQAIKNHFVNMLLLAKKLSEFIVFYNGPQCGASAPDHFHFQAGNRHFLPVESLVRNKAVVNNKEFQIWTQNNYFANHIIIRSSSVEVLIDIFTQLYDFLKNDEANEPKMNIFCFYEQNNWEIFIFPRVLHRPLQYFADEKDNIMLSPASVDLGGVMILPRKKDFEKITKNDLIDIFSQVCVGNEVLREICDLL